MKEMLIVPDRTQFVRGICGSALLVGAAVLFTFAFWMSGSIARAESPEGTSNHSGSSDPSKCTICHVTRMQAKTMTINCSKVQKFLRHHPGDCLGPCPCQPTPTTNL